VEKTTEEAAFLFDASTMERKNKRHFINFSKNIRKSPLHSRIISEGAIAPVRRKPNG